MTFTVHQCFLLLHLSLERDQHSQIKSDDLPINAQRHQSGTGWDISSPPTQHRPTHFRDSSPHTLLITRTNQRWRRIKSFRPELAVIVCTSIRWALFCRDFKCLSVCLWLLFVLGLTINYMRVLGMTINYVREQGL